MPGTKSNLNIGVVGTGIAGMSAAWLLSKAHNVNVYEKDDRVGGHTNTIRIDDLNIDTGFIVYNVKNYPNLIAMFEHLDVDTQSTDMSFGVSMDQGDFEYAGTDLFGMLAQKKNIFRPRFWKLMRDILRFYKESGAVLGNKTYEHLTLGEYLTVYGYSDAFIKDHLLPMGAAIWSTPVDTMLDYPLESFIRFCDNHGLLQISDRPQWRTVMGGSHAYVDKLTAPYRENIHLNRGVKNVWSEGKYAYIEDRNGNIEKFDHVVMASHGDQTREMLNSSFSAEKRLFKAFKYQPNIAHLHTDKSLMPRNKKAWSSWNYLGETINGKDNVCVTYWMNKLQKLPGGTDYFVTLNPTQMPSKGSLVRSFLYHHPLFDRDAIAAQRLLWNIQGTRRIWYCGSYFGYGFHEDGLQSGLAVAEALGGVRRPWEVKNESGRINILQDSRSNFNQDAA